jgi:UDP-N-acetylmuramyl pentapeptide synthase
MLELGPDERRFHAEMGAHARARGVGLLIAVGPRAAAMVPPFGGEARAVPDAAAAAKLLPGLVRSGDTVLIKGSRGVGLEIVADALDAAIS